MLTNNFTTAKSKLIRELTVCFEDVVSSRMMYIVIGNYFYEVV